MTNNKKKSKILLLLIIIIFIPIFLFFIYLSYIKNLTSENILKSLGEVTKQDAKTIENKIEEHKRILETIVNATKQEQPLSEKEIFKIFERNAGNEEFSRIGILYENGETSTSDGGIVDLSEDLEYFFQTENIQLSKTRKSKVNDEEINIYSKKMNWNNKEIVILLVIETDKYEKLFSQTIYNGRGVEYIITAEGEITSNSKNEKNGRNIFDELRKDNDNKAQNAKNIEKMEEDIKENISSQIVYKLNNNNNYIAYQKLSIEDWYLVIATPGSVIAEELNKILELTFIISIIIIITIVIVSTYIIINNIKKQENLYNLAYIDNVTKLGNYNYFIEKGNSYLNKKEKETYVLALDIDKFKSFNKKHGHEIGSKLLLNIGKILKEELNEESIVCRIANDIFGMVLITDEKIDIKIKQICKKLKIIKIDEKEYLINISLGVYKIKNDESEIIQALDKALIAHNMVKGNYNVEYQIFNEQMEEEIIREHDIEVEMEKALENNEFKVYYQPKISTKDNKMIAAEALVRWIKEDKIISPNEFIPIFEKNQFIVKLDKYIFEKVCQDIIKWKEKYSKIPIISVNVSKEQFIYKNFIKEYENILKKYDLKANEIEIEITESATINNNIDILKIMKDIKEIGFIISIDDFGTGYSSLNMLQTMPIDIIKIDKTFIDKIDIKNNKENLVDYIILIAKKLKLKTVAEGVETEEQVRYLKELGCDIIQGYFYSKPLRKEEFEKYIINSNHF